MGKGVPLTIRLGVCMGEHCKLPRRDPGRKPDRKWILRIFHVRKKQLEHPFQYFER